MSKSQAERLIEQLDQISFELMSIATTDGAKRRVKDVRTEMGFESGGYVGHTTLDELLEKGGFDEECEEEED